MQKRKKKKSYSGTISINFACCRQRKLMKMKKKKKKRKKKAKKREEGEHTVRSNTFTQISSFYIILIYLLKLVNLFGLFHYSSNYVPGIAALSFFISLLVIKRDEFCELPLHYWCDFYGFCGFFFYQISDTSCSELYPPVLLFHTNTSHIAIY